MFPTEMFATATHRKILRVLAEQNKRYTIRELAEMCHRTPASVSRALGSAERYPFIEKDRVSGSRTLTFRLDPDSPYSAPIREFFEIEHDRERQHGTVPVEVWNLLEDVANRLDDEVDGFYEVFLFGSYATGEYYAGSDIDLIVAHSGETDVWPTIDSATQKIGDERLQVLTVHVDASDPVESAVVLEAVRQQTPVDDLDVLIPLTGEVAV